MKERRITFVFVCSYLASGKTSLSQAIVQMIREQFNKEALFVEVSDIVKMVLKEQERSKLQGHPELDQIIIGYLMGLQAARNSIIVVSGVRQTSILEAFPDSELIWIDTPHMFRKERFLQRKDVKDLDYEFETANIKDVELGIEQVKQYIFNRHNSENS